MGPAREVLIKFREAILEIPSVATNVIKITVQKMADTSKDELLLGRYATSQYVAVSDAR